MRIAIAADKVWLNTEFEGGRRQRRIEQSNERPRALCLVRLQWSMPRLIDKLLRWLGVANVPRVRKLFVGVVGMTVLLIGLALLILPGPACVVIPLGLAILATEFVWARRWLDKAKAWLNKAKGKFAKQAK